MFLKSFVRKKTQDKKKMLQFQIYNKKQKI